MEQELLTMLEECALQIEYLQSKFVETGSGNAVMSRAKALIEKVHKADTLEVLLEKMPGHIVLRRFNGKWVCHNLATNEMLSPTAEETAHQCLLTYQTVYNDKEVPTR